jgi:hypothetical protein
MLACLSPKNLPFSASLRILSPPPPRGGDRQFAMFPRWHLFVARLKWGSETLGFPMLRPHCHRVLNVFECPVAGMETVYDSPEGSTDSLTRLPELPFLVLAMNCGSVLFTAPSAL